MKTKNRTEGKERDVSEPRREERHNRGTGPNSRDFLRRAPLGAEKRVQRKGKRSGGNIQRNKQPMTRAQSFKRIEKVGGRRNRGTFVNGIRSRVKQGESTSVHLESRGNRMAWGKQKRRSPEPKKNWEQEKGTTVQPSSQGGVGNGGHAQT